jgi:hypothetical protein
MSTRRRPSRLALVATLAAVAVAVPLGAAAAAPEEGASPQAVNLLVFRQGGAGSASTAQKYVDQVMTTIGTLTGWQISGKYVTTRSQADAYIAESSPKFGIVSLSAFLPMAGKYKLRATGKAKVKGGGGGQYFIVSKNQFDLEGCKGKTLASDHADDAKFVDNVVFAKKMSLGDFQLQKTKRSLQTVKAVIRDEAECALVDDAQVADLGHIVGGVPRHGGGGLRGREQGRVEGVRQEPAQGVRGRRQEGVHGGRNRVAGDRRRQGIPGLPRRLRRVTAASP